MKLCNKMDIKLLLMNGDADLLFLIRLIDKWKLFLAFFFMIISSFNGVVLSLIVVHASSFSSSTTMKEIIFFGLSGLLGWSLVYLASYFFEILTASMIKQINTSLKQRYFWKEFMSITEIKNSSEIISGLTNDWKLIENNYLRSIFSVISNGMLLVVSLIYMVYLNPLVSIIFLFFSFLPIIVPKIFMSKLTASANNWSIANEKFTKTIKEFFQGMNVLKNYSAQKEVYRNSKKSLVLLENGNYKVTAIQSLAELLLSLLSGVSFIVPFVIGCLLIHFSKSMSISILIAIFLANDRVVGPLQEIATCFNKIISTKDLRKKLFISSQKVPIDSHEVVNKTKRMGEIEFKDVTYSLNNGEVLKLNFSLKGNFKVLLHGDSGSGKTTILNLVKRTIIPDLGEIIITDSLGERMNIEDNVAYIEQTPYIFDTSVRNNITLFQNDLITDEEIIQVLKKVSLFNELGKKESLDYICGDNGNKLSGGQRQRIEIARALVHHKALYLVDEATANLDKKNSEQIRDILFSLEVPVIEVAHHYSIDDMRYTERFKLVRGALVPV